MQSNICQTNSFDHAKVVSFLTETCVPRFCLLPRTLFSLEEKLKPLILILITAMISTIGETTFIKSWYSTKCIPTYPNLSGELSCCWDFHIVLCQFRYMKLFAVKQYSNCGSFKCGCLEGAIIARVASIVPFLNWNSLDWFLQVKLLGFSPTYSLSSNLRAFLNCNRWDGFREGIFLYLWRL